MKAAIFEGTDGVKVKEVDQPRIRNPEDVLVRVRACSICGTDLAVLEGRHPAELPVILGHEVAGEVSSVGTGFAPFNPATT